MYRRDDLKTEGSDGVIQASLRRRKPGDPLPSDVVRLLRQRRGLSQDALASQMGLSGKNVVSGWETGRTSCDGPAAELLLRIAGAGTATLAAEDLSAQMHSEWTRAGDAGSPRLWREFMCVFDSDLELAREKWLDLFPGLAIPPTQCVHGFPFVDRTLAPDVFGIGPKGWSGWINTDRKIAPSYGWILKRDGRFAYRERAWEEDPRAVTHPSVLVGSLLELALAGAFLAREIAKKWEFEKSQHVLMRLDMSGMQGRGIVGQEDASGNLVDRTNRTSNENYLSAENQTTIEKLVEDPAREGLELVAEFVMPLRPDLAQISNLKKQLEHRRAFDQRQGAIRRLGFLG